MSYMKKLQVLSVFAGALVLPIAAFGASYGGYGMGQGSGFYTPSLYGSFGMYGMQQPSYTVINAPSIQQATYSPFLSQGGYGSGYGSGSGGYGMGQYGMQYQMPYQNMYQPTQYGSGYGQMYQPYQQQSQYQNQYQSGYGSNYGTGYGGQYTVNGLTYSQPVYGNNSYAAMHPPQVSYAPTGDYDFFGNPLCRFSDYPTTAPCGQDPQQPVYDPYTQTWY